MKIALYARVSTESQEARGTIGSQLDALRVFAQDAGHDIVSEFIDDGHSGSRLNRPGLDALRDAAEAGLFEAVLCLTPDRLARAFAHQYIVLEELARHQVRVIFSDAPPLDDDPQARLLVQMQGVIAEYERSKITERHRRGKLFRARMGEVISWSVPYGYRRVPRSPHSPPHVEVFEPEAEVVRRIYNDYVNGGFSVRQIAKRLFADGVPTPFGRKPVWHESTLSRILRNPAYIGTLYYNVRKTTKRPTRTGKQGHTERLRPEEEWIPIRIPAILADDVFEAAQRVARDNSRFSPRHLKNEAWLLRYLVVCGTCGSVLASVQYPGRRSPLRYYRCPKMSQNLERTLTNCRCPQRQVRASQAPPSQQLLGLLEPGCGADEVAARLGRDGWRPLAWSLPS
jgi:site-specific DNA recombinase